MPSATEGTRNEGERIRIPSESRTSGVATESSADVVAKRLVFLFPGFEPMTAAEHCERFRRGARQTAATFGVAFETEDRAVEPIADPVFPRLLFRGAGESWATRTEVLVCGWGDLVLDLRRRPVPTRLATGLRALGEFVANGTFFRYCRTSWRYALFFLFPILAILAILAVGVVLAGLPFLAGLSAVHLLWSLPIGLASAAALAVLVDRRLHLLTAMDDWTFASDLCHVRSPAIERRIGEQTDAIARHLAQPGDREILLAAHSLGASLAVLALSDALARAENPPPVRVLTVGSSLMKTALHPGGGRQRDAVRALVERHRLAWVDVQSVSDPINFYRSNPALTLGIREGRTPLVRRISLRDLVSEKTYRRVRGNFFRLHRQFVFGTEKRHNFSFHMICLGPVPFERYAATLNVDQPPLSPAGAASR